MYEELSSSWFSLCGKFTVVDNETYNHITWYHSLVKLPYKITQLCKAQALYLIKGTLFWVINKFYNWNIHDRENLLQ